MALAIAGVLQLLGGHAWGFLPEEAVDQGSEVSADIGEFLLICAWVGLPKGSHGVPHQLVDKPV